MNPFALLVFILATLAYGCQNNPDDQTVVPVARVRPDDSRTTTGPWIITSDGDQQTFAQDPAAATLYAAIEGNPADPTSRESLSHEYSATGYATVSQFFEATAKFTQTANVPLYEPPSVFHALCSPDKGVAAVPILPLFAENIRAFTGELKRVLAEVRAIDATHERNDCAFLLAWAETIRLATLNGLPTTDAERERAVRILLTLADDAALFPPHSDSAAEVYLSVATLFASRHDFQASHCALVIARSRVDRARYFPDRKTDVLQAIDHLQEAVDKSMRRSNTPLN